MSQLNGEISVDRGYRDAVAGGSSSSGTLEVELRAEKAGSGEYSEDLGRLGSEPWNMPGQGESGHRCGEWHPSSICDTCAHADMIARSCGKRSCPNCYGMWAQEAGIRATTRVQAFRYTQPDNHKKQIAHAVVSPFEGAVMTKREYWEGKKKAGEIAKEKGFRGFAVIPHPWRVTEAGKARYNEEDPDCGIWVWLRNLVDDMEQYIYWSPHYHIIGATSVDMEPAKEGDEWAYSMIRTFGRFEGTRDSESHDEVYGAFRYLLSHTGYPEGSTKQVVTWQGCLANSVFVEEATEEWQYEKPSEGILSTIEREVEKVAGRSEDEDMLDDDTVVPEEEVDRCPCQDCDGEMIDVFDVTAFLRQRQPPPEVEEAMIAARDWRLGRREPPPGLKRPQTEEQAREAFQELL